MSVAEKLVAVAKNMPRVYDAGRDAVIGDSVKVVGSVRQQNHSLYPKIKTIADGIKDAYEAGQASAAELWTEVRGSTVTATDVNPIEHNTGARLESKNLFDISKFAKVNTTINGITYEQLDNGYIHVYGKIEDNTIDPSYKSEMLDSSERQPMLPVGYTLYTYQKWVTGGYVSLLIQMGDENNEFVQNLQGTFGGSIDIPQSPRFFRINVDSNITDELDIMIPAQMEAGNKAVTQYTPFVSDFTKVRTRNIYPFFEDYGRTSSPGTARLLEVLPNGFIFQGGYEESSHSISSWDNGWGVFGGDGEWLYLRAEETVTISADYTVLEAHESRTGHESIGIWFYGNNTQYASVTHSIPSEIGKPTRVRATYTVYVDGYYWPIFTLNSNKVKIENLQIEYGTAATPYVPYTIPAVVTKRGKNFAPPFTASATVDNVTMSIANGYVSFEGSVPSGGYTGVQLYIPESEAQKFLFPSGTYRTGYFTGVSDTVQFGMRDISTHSWVINISCSVPAKLECTGYIRYLFVRITEEMLGKSYPLFVGSCENNEVFGPANYEPYIPPITYPADADGNLGEVPSISPTMILEPNSDHVMVSCGYYKE